MITDAEVADITDPIVRLSKDLRQAAATLSDSEARYLVDAYYQMQSDRIRAANQVRSLSESEEPHQVIAWLNQNTARLEGQIKAALDVYSSSSTPGRWAKSIVGIGPVLAAGLLAHLVMEPWRCVNKNMRKACRPGAPCSPECTTRASRTVGEKWRFAGLDPTVTWNKGEKRPWNASLKTLCWKIGESFVKVSTNENDVYGRLYVARKEYEQRRNFAGELAEQATRAVTARHYGTDTDARLWYYGHLTVDAARQILSSPAERRIGLARKLSGAADSGTRMLPPAHIHARAKRWAVKLFLAHYFTVAYRDHFGTMPPRPYVFEHLGHVHELPVPNWPF
jgi:hypothetical protein